MYIWSMKLVSFVILHSLVASLFIPEGDTLKILFLGDIMQHQAQLDAAQERGRAKLNSGHPLCFRRVKKAELISFLLPITTPATKEKEVFMVAYLCTTA